MARGRKKQYHLYTKFGNKYYNLNNFDLHCHPQPNGCIHYEGARHVQGYGMCGYVNVDTDKRHMTVTHRAAMEIHLNRELKPGENVVHIPGCEPNCVNPQHLQIGDLSLRNTVMVANGRAGRGRRGPGGEYLPLEPQKQNRQYRWSEAEILKIRNQPTDVTAAQFGWTRQKASKMRWEMRNHYRWLK